MKRIRPSFPYAIRLKSDYGKNEQDSNKKK